DRHSWLAAFAALPYSRGATWKRKVRGLARGKGGLDGGEPVAHAACTIATFAAPPAIVGLVKRFSSRFRPRAPTPLFSRTPPLLAATDRGPHSRQEESYAPLPTMRQLPAKRFGR